MRIGFIIYGSLDTLTGGYLYDLFVVKGLRELGHEVDVISLPSGSYLKRLAMGLTPGRCRQLLAGKFDILIQDELCHPSLFIINRQLRRHNGPLLLGLVHHILSREPRSRWLNMLLAMVERRFLASVDGFIHNSLTTQQTVASLVDHQQPQIIANPAGDRFGSPLSSEIISKRAHRPGPLELLFLGNVIPRKGLLPLLEALAGIHRDFWRLSIVGDLDFDHAYTTRARQFVQRHDLSDSVRFMGPLEDENLIEILGYSHIFCMPYAYEGFGIAILESMAFGLPAIGCLSGAASETINHGKNGYLLAADDLKGLEALLLQLYQNREELQQLALGASATYRSRPGWQDGIAIIDTFLKQIVNQKK
ncbi:MAG: glycosyltransferase family 4 protein [Desulforhopalus sp.]